MNQTIDDHFESINSDEFLVSALQMLGKAIGFRAEREFESGWVDAVTRMVSSHPDPYIRAVMVSAASLRQLKVLLTDEHLGVRVACASSPFAIDADVQLAVANDSEAVVVHALLDSHDPYLHVMRGLVNSPHRSVRRRIASLNLNHELLTVLSQDSDRKVASAAASTLATRHRRQQASKRRITRAKECS
mgnify:CR=1 FL=1